MNTTIVKIVRGKEIESEMMRNNKREIIKPNERNMENECTVSVLLTTEIMESE